MSPFEGRERYGVSFEEINDYNKILLNLMNYFADSIREGKETALIRTTIEELDDCIKLHLKGEERILASIDYPYLSEHKDRHHLLLDQFAVLKHVCESGQPYLVQNVLLSMRYWLIHHIFSVEKEYFLYCEARHGSAPHTRPKMGNT